MGAPGGNVKLTPKQERFAQEVASGKSQADAYRAAFDVNVGTKPETIQITLESHLADLQMLRDKAMESNQLSAAISAEIARGKASGVHVEKSEQTVTTKSLPASVDEFV